MPRTDSSHTLTHFSGSAPDSRNNNRKNKKGGQNASSSKLKCPLN